MVTRETGRVELIHLKELDLPQTNLDFGQNKNLLLYLWFDSMSDGSLINNIRETYERCSSMTWGYIDGTRHHLVLLNLKV
jgi:hypothetical protein